MPSQLPCDICKAEPAVQMLTNLETGDTLTVGAACIPLFYAQSLTISGVDGDHSGPPTRCHTCKQIHALVNTGMALAADSDGDQAGPPAVDLDASAEPVTP